MVDRQYLVFYLRLFDGLSSKVLGHLVDFSTKGLMMISDEPIEVNEDYRLRMCLPAQLKERRDIIFTATSRWCQKDNNPDFYLSGFRLHALDEKTERIIIHLLKEFSYP